MTRRGVIVHARISVALTGLLALMPASGASAQFLSDELPPELEGVGIVERLGSSIPMDLAFVDSDGSPVTLGELLDSERPVILTLNYYRCPMLCTLTLNGLVDGLRGMAWSVGEEYRIVTVSFNPEEGPSLASAKQRAYLGQYGRDTPAEAWRFLTGEHDDIEALCRAVGFGYRRDERTGDYAHPASIIFITPAGRISRYMNDVQFEPRDLRLALVEASEGTIGSPLEQFLLYTCYRYDASANSYVLGAWRVMRLGGLFMVLVLAAGLALLWRRGGVYDVTTRAGDPPPLGSPTACSGEGSSS